MRPLTLARRRMLLSLTAASGCLENLEWLAERVGCALSPEVPEATAAAGRLGMCWWLLQQGNDVWPGRMLLFAAEAGQHVLVRWLLANYDTPDGDQIRDMCSAAARGGHVSLMDWLLQRFELGRGKGAWMGLFAAAAVGCDLPTLQRLLRAPLQEDPPFDLLRFTLVPAVCGSRTPDWKAKVEWLEETFGGPVNTTGACSRAASLPDALERLTWLRGRGCSWDQETARQAAVSGNLDALKYLLAEGCPVEPFTLGLAAGAGQLAALQALHAHGTAFTPAAWSKAMESAARGGRLPVVAWLLEAGLVPPEWLQQHGAKMLEAATGVGSMELLAWLREHGCSWGGATISAAAEAGSEEVLEWLVAQGCPVQVPAYSYAASPYAIAALNGDWSTLACLHRLGYPFDDRGGTFLDAVRRGCWVPGLRKLLELGCPVDWWRAAEVAASIRDAGMVAWLAEQQLARRGAVADSDDDDDDAKEAEDEDDGAEEDTEETGEEEEALPEPKDGKLGQ